jgi:uncharacterized protein (DUF1499 family)
MSIGIYILGFIVGVGIVGYASIPRLGREKGEREYGENMEFLPVPESPNCVMSTLDVQDEKYVKPLVIPESEQDAAIEFMKDLMVKEFGAKVLYENSKYLHVTVQTRLMRYVDDVEFIWDEDRKVMQVRSCSRLGYSDMGANRARVERIREMLLYSS